jgi:hypothetical protein
LNAANEKEYIGVTMSTAIRNDIRREVMNYLKRQEAPVKMSNMANELRETHQKLSAVRDADVRAVVQPMIVAGKISYAPGLKIKLGATAK